MNTVACLLGLLTLTTSQPTLVLEAGANQPRMQVVSSFVPACGVTFLLSCRPVGTRTTWAITAWAQDGTLVGMTTQRTTDPAPVVVSGVQGQAYRQVVIQQPSLLPPQSVTVTATRTGGCQTAMRVEAEP